MAAPCAPVTPLALPAPAGGASDLAKTAADPAGRHRPFRTTGRSSDTRLDITEVTGVRPTWTGCPAPVSPRDCLVQLRAHGDVRACTAWLDGDVLRIRLHRPARGVAKGQAAVLYEGDAVLGSATISSTSAAAQLARVR